MFGEIGVLLVDGDHVQCHECGRWFRDVGVHAARGHGLLRQDYRVKFGLRSDIALCAPYLRAEKRRVGLPSLIPGGIAGPSYTRRVSEQEKREPAFRAKVAAAGRLGARAAERDARGRFARRSSR